MGSISLAGEVLRQRCEMDNNLASPPICFQGRMITPFSLAGFFFSIARNISLHHSGCYSFSCLE